MASRKKQLDPSGHTLLLSLALARPLSGFVFRPSGFKRSRPPSLFPPFLPTSLVAHRMLHFSSRCFIVRWSSDYFEFVSPCVSTMTTPCHRRAARQGREGEGGRTLGLTVSANAGGGRAGEGMKEIKMWHSWRESRQSQGARGLGIS